MKRVPRAVWTRLLPPRPSPLSVNQTPILKRDARRAAVAPSHRLVWLGWREPCTVAAAVVLLPLASCLPAPCQCLSAAYTLSACHTPDGCLVVLLNKHLSWTGAKKKNLFIEIYRKGMSSDCLSSILCCRLCSVSVSVTKETNTPKFVTVLLSAQFSHDIHLNTWFRLKSKT